jgi:hypothetical protein
MKTTCLIGALLAALLPRLAAADEQEMKFWTRDQQPSTAPHQVRAYRIEDEMLIVVHDPVVCGQSIANPQYSIESDELVVRYELGAAPAGAGPSGSSACVAHSVFKIEHVPDRDLKVRFAGGSEAFTEASLKRCPSQSPRYDQWDCLVPAQ